VVAALRAAIDQFIAEGGQPARGARYAANCAALIDGMRALGFRPFLDATVQAPIIVTFHAPSDPAYEFKDFYDRVRARGYILYPGKLTQVETFRVGCIGAIDANEMRNVVTAIGATLQDMASAVPRRRCARRESRLGTSSRQRHSRGAPLMKIGVPKEIKVHEYRVGLTPTSVREVIAHGQRGAGADAGRRPASAPLTPTTSAPARTIVGGAAEVFGAADMIVKVKEPQAVERRLLREGQVLFTYLHLAPIPTRPRISSPAARSASPTRPSPRRPAACRCWRRCRR